jgi:hypothetical protein
VAEPAYFLPKEKEDLANPFWMAIKNTGAVCAPVFFSTP